MTKRLTEKITPVAGGNTIGYKIKPYYERQAVKKLAEYENAEEEGKLMMLPCKVRDYIWDIDFGTPCSYEITGLSIGNLNDEAKSLDEVIFYYSSSDGSITGKFAVSEIGKSVFLTKEEAEKALKVTENK